jgi:uncharacterized PurR-regulated membrane protein YhhQ (DUF165 family)
MEVMSLTQKTCCITGHRKLDPSKIEPLKKALRSAIMAAIAEGYAYLISGFADVTIGVHWENYSKDGFLVRNHF